MSSIFMNQYESVSDARYLPPSFILPNARKRSQLYIHRRAAFGAGDLSYEPVSSDARGHLELSNTEKEDKTLKASCSSLIAHGSVPPICNLTPYLLFIISRA
ncbi:unnamed protein product [Pleuronectes platessa]|uniref:Uncharacterized protein n=1 Tax=Pleuronectes platessa TaxID=8262 RepID=A0A9N7YKI6_PLEPL|nr:unnamed protein product [Pleuronectes platessa]